MNIVKSTSEDIFFNGKPIVKNMSANILVSNNPVIADTVLFITISSQTFGKISPILNASKISVVESAVRDRLYHEPYYIEIEWVEIQSLYGYIEFDGDTGIYTADFIAVGRYVDRDGETGYYAARVEV